MQKTIEELRGVHATAVEVNRALPVAVHHAKEGAGESSQPSDRIFEVTDGIKHVLGADRMKYERLAPGRRFRPTVGELENNARALRGKARELTATERRGLSIGGSDVGIRALPLTGGALKAALAEGLTEADFATIRPQGVNGEFTKGQVDELIKARASKVS